MCQVVLGSGWDTEMTKTGITCNFYFVLFLLFSHNEFIMRKDYRLPQPKKSQTRYKKSDQAPLRKPKSRGGNRCAQGQIYINHGKFSKEVPTDGTIHFDAGSRRPLSAL